MRFNKDAGRTQDAKEEFIEFESSDDVFITRMQTPLIQRTRQIAVGYAGQADGPMPGEYGSRVVYLLFNGILEEKSITGGKALTGAVFDMVPKFDGPKVIYAAANTIGTRGALEGITFEQTPYALEL